MNSNQLIKAKLQHLEQSLNIKILFAVEAGSRVWRLDSEDSDYDIRCVFVRPYKEYLRLNKHENIFNVAYDELGDPHDIEGAFIDILGFDLYKFTNLLKKSNPSCIEWLMSDIIYYGEKNEVFFNWMRRNYNHFALHYHYKSMCKQNYEKYIKSGNMISYKKYLYSMRGLINAKYVEKTEKLPLIDFIKQLEISEDIVSKDIINKLHKMIALKKDSKEKEIVQNSKRMDNYIESFLKIRNIAFLDIPKKNFLPLEEEVLRILLEGD